MKKQKKNIKTQFVFLSMLYPVVFVAFKTGIKWTFFPAYLIEPETSINGFVKVQLLTCFNGKGFTRLDLKKFIHQKQSIHVVLLGKETKVPSYCVSPEFNGLAFEHLNNNQDDSKVFICKGVYIGEGRAFSFQGQEDKLEEQIKKNQMINITNLERETTNLFYFGQVNSIGY